MFFLTIAGLVMQMTSCYLEQRSSALPWTLRRSCLVTMAAPATSTETSTGPYSTTSATSRMRASSAGMSELKLEMSDDCKIHIVTVLWIDHPLFLFCKFFQTASICCLNSLKRPELTHFCCQNYILIMKFTYTLLHP